MRGFIIVIFSIAITLASKTSQPCVPKNVEFGIVCVCNATYCDSLDSKLPTEEGASMLVTSSEAGERFSYSTGIFTKEEMLDQFTFQLNINRSIKYQKIRGFGTSVSGSVTYILNELPANLRHHIYRSYFSSDVGIGYNMIRLPIGGCDFDSEPWAYNETPANDSRLSNFTTLDPRESNRNIILKEINGISSRGVEFLAAAWSPPPWMKERNEWNGSPDELKDNQLREEFYQCWADYHLKWLDLMAKDSIRIDGLSTGNEPAVAHLSPIMALSWNASNHARFIAENLVPTIMKSNYSDVKIHGYDDNRDVVLPYMEEMLSTHPEAMDYISTIDVHGYYDNKSSPYILDALNTLYEKPILYTEMSFGGGNMEGTGPKIGSWNRGEKLVANIMGALNHYAVGYVDWNMILDHRGGPSYAQNFVDAAIMTNADFTEAYKQPLFFAMAHFAKFITPGSIRIHSNSTQPESNVVSVSFLRPDNRIATVIYNNGTTIIGLTINDSLKGYTNIQIEPKSINTLVY